MDYLEFLRTKIDIAKETGFEVDKNKLNKALKPHQKDAVAWALRGGLGTVPYTALKMNRKGYMCELSTDYFRDAVGYLQAMENDMSAPTLFDFFGIAEENKDE